jgi:CARDB
MVNRLAIAAVLVAGAVTAPSTAAVAKAPDSAGVKVASCSPDTHSAAFKARMTWVSGTQQMALRFRLLEKGASGFRLVKAPGLGRWRKSKPGVGVFAYRQGVRGLQAGAIYKVAVDFRWYDKDGDLIQFTRRYSPSCRQFLSLPNLTAKLTGSTPGRKAGVVRYQVRVANTGFAAASAIALRLLVDGAVIDTATVASLQPGERRWLSILGPECTRSVEAIADPDGVIVESSENDNADESTCASLTRR